MAYGLGDIVAKATSSLPLPRLGRWEIQVKNEERYEQDVGDGFFASIKKVAKAITGFYDNVKEAASDFFSYLSGDENAFEYRSIADFDSLIDCSIQKDSTVVNNPIEQGSFRSVNKVMKPTIAKITLAKGGFYKGIEVCLEALDELQNSTKKCRIVTPFGITKDLNLYKFTYTYKRETGSYLLIANLELMEIREGSVIDSSVKNPVDSDMKNTGVKVLKAGSKVVDSVKGAWKW